MANDHPGPGVDAAGRAVIDPTENVIAILAAAVQRQDDLRDSERRLRDAESAHVREILALNSRHASEMLSKESERLDAVRETDVGAVQRAAEVQATVATALAAQVTVSAETLRNQVSAAATATATALAAALVPLQEAIADLRRVQYEQQGQKAAVVESRGSSAALYGAVGFGISILLALLTVAGFVLANRP